MNLSFTPEAFADYQFWIENKAIFKKINLLLKEMLRTPFEGTGKPEPLKYELSGCYSRRITDEHRLVYKVENDSLIIISCRFHY
ncbi:MAG: Txe/YoeB family addiction module toxin [Spirochaetaceae bacterium]|nr:Txe/YoeB family addiction module toxin [Spirochaetaceae bacterium]